jgi:hypothetical protein
MSRLVALVLVLAAVIAPVLAAANVPDPTWIAGVYDGADADEVLALVWDQTPAAVAAALVLDGRVEARLDVVPLRAALTALPAPSPASRAPPRS